MQFLTEFYGHHMIKNFIAYAMDNASNININSLNASLSAAPFVPCSSYQTISKGWVASGEEPEHAREIGDFIKMTLAIERRDVPAFIVKAEMDEAIKKFTSRMGSKPNKEDKRQIKDDVLAKLLPRAFPKRAVLEAWVDKGRNLFIVGTSSASSAEDLIKFLNGSASGLESIRKIGTTISPTVAMTDWLTSDAPLGFTTDDQCELVLPSDGKPTVKYVRHSLSGLDITDHIASGKVPVSLAMTYDDRMSFVFTDKLVFKGLKALDVFSEELSEAGAETVEALQDAEFSMVAADAGAIAEAIIAELGGELVSGT